MNSAWISHLSFKEKQCLFLEKQYFHGLAIKIYPKQLKKILPIEVK